MSITGIRSVSGDISVKKSSNDSYEINIKKQIHTLEEKMKAISNDDEKSAEQKTKEKQAAQEQLQNLNQELREYEIRKQQEESAKKQEAIKKALSDTNQPQADTLSSGLDATESGVMVTLSSTHEQLSPIFSFWLFFVVFFSNGFLVIRDRIVCSRHFFADSSGKIVNLFFKISFFFFGFSRSLFPLQIISETYHAGQLFMSGRKCYHHT